MEHAYAVVLFGFSGHDATFSLMRSRDLCDWFLIIFFFILSRSYIILLVYGLMHFHVFWTEKEKHVFLMDFLLWTALTWLRCEVLLTGLYWLYILPLISKQSCLLNLIFFFVNYLYVHCWNLRYCALFVEIYVTVLCLLKFTLLCFVCWHLRYCALFVEIYVTVLCLLRSRGIWLCIYIMRTCLLTMKLIFPT